MLGGASELELLDRLHQAFTAAAFELQTST
jgi:hypothetical protein